MKPSRGGSPRPREKFSLPLPRWFAGLEVILGADHRRFRRGTTLEERVLVIVAELVLPVFVFESHLECVLGTAQDAPHVQHYCPVEVGCRYGSAAEFVGAFRADIVEIALEAEWRVAEGNAPNYVQLGMRFVVIAAVDAHGCIALAQHQHADIEETGNIHHNRRASPEHTLFGAVANILLGVPVKPESTPTSAYERKFVFAAGDFAQNDCIAIYNVRLLSARGDVNHRRNIAIGNLQYDVDQV